MVGWKTKTWAYEWGLMRQHRVNARVISIGNITAGGTGKTPATIHFAQTYSREGHSTAVLSRGYGRTTPINEPHAISNGKHILLSPREAGDEPYLMAKKLEGVPVVVCGDRVKGARYIIENFGSELIVLDDGFQHTAIARDEDIVVINCLNPFGHGHLLPRGLLREPLSALARATSFLLTHAHECEHGQIVDALREINPTAAVRKSRHLPVRLVSLGEESEASCDIIAGKKVLALSSIGNPNAFEATLEGLGAQVAESLRFKDHHWYSANDIENIEAAAKQVGAEYVISTEKDGVRLSCTPKAPENVFLLEIELQLID